MPFITLTFNRIGYERSMATQVSRASSTAGVLAGKTAVITGAGRGVGKAIATVFAQAGAHTILVVRDRRVGERIAAQLRKQGYSADVGVADITNAAQLSMLVLKIMQRRADVDILVNNAGVFLREDREMRPSNIDPLILDRTLSVNLYGPIQVCDAFIPHIARGGRIINVSSRMGQFAGESDAYGPAYSISKAALNMYTQLLAADLREREIMVDAFHPGWVKTDMGGPAATVDPEDAAETALFLAARPSSERSGLFWERGQVIDW
ncbi:MAG TPA: SDR family NAD(P)-dependent oxidoreductase [Candidatus Eremiobacteraceae bacterium]|nr:SDR family NAD(P)-dependent oxidoreductase [Candidatus Eremiobacteraceae bacterium]